jgi:hypothetical protein
MIGGCTLSVCKVSVMNDKVPQRLILYPTQDVPGPCSPKAISCYPISSVSVDTHGTINHESILLYGVRRKVGFLPPS